MRHNSYSVFWGVTSVLLSILFFVYFNRILFFIPLAVVAFSSLKWGKTAAYVCLTTTLLGLIAALYSIGYLNSAAAVEAPALRLFLYGIVGIYIAWLGGSYKNALIASTSANRMRDDFIAVLSHDLKNPVAAIDLNAKLIERNHTQSKAVIEGAGRILRSTEIMRRLIGSLLDIAKIESGSFQIEKKENNISSLISSVVEILKPLADEKGVIVSTESIFPSKASFDFDRVFQVLSNVGGNAVKFTPAGGVVKFGCSEHDRDILFTISDTGTGISPENIEKIFTRFWQNKETSRDGSGLGLAISKGIVETHGGKIWVESTLMKGSTFFISLPKG